jgi:RHS repeat-associated protein
MAAARIPVSFKYDPFGRRIYKSSSAGTSIYGYDGDNLIEETNASGGVVARYAQTENVDEPLAMLRSSTTSYYHADGLGSVTSLSNAAGALAQTYGYDSFGKQTTSSGSLTNTFQYTSREFDTETGLYYYRARYMDPSNGRFSSEDPIRFRGGEVNFYGYARQDPVLFVDPSGNNYCKFDNCFKIFQRAIKHFSRSGFDATANATPVFYPPSPALSSLTQADVVGGSNSTPLNQSLPYGAGGTRIHGPWGSAILLGPNAFIPSNDPDATYLHELIHAYTDLNDDQVFNLFKPYGLKHLNPGSYDITLWIMSNCKNTGSAK